jgi:hypothetical protein
MQQSVIQNVEVSEPFFFFTPVTPNSLSHGNYFSFSSFKWRCNLQQNCRIEGVMAMKRMISSD